MKTKFLTMGLLCSLIFVACEKDESLENQDRNHAKSNGFIKTSYTDSDGQVNQRKYLEYLASKYNITADEFNAKADQIEVNLGLAKNSKLQKDEPEFIPLDEIFLFYEGAINGSIEDIIDPKDEINTYDQVLEIDIIEMESEYFVSQADFEAFFNSTFTFMDSISQNDSDSYIFFSDYSLMNLTETKATILNSISVGTQMPLPTYNGVYPSGAVYAALRNEYCNFTSPPYTWDAATIARGFLMSFSLLATPCPNNPTYNGRPIQLANYTASNHSTTVTYNLSSNSLMSNYAWFGTTNECIGDDNDPQHNETEWLSLMNSSKGFIDIMLHPTPKFSNPYTAPVGSLFSSYFSKSNWKSINGVSYQYYHTGTFTFGVRFC